MSFENLFTKAYCRLWLRLVPGYLDLDVEEYAKATPVGVRPEWLDDDIIEAVGLDSLLPDGYDTSIDAPRLMTWGLRYGIGPYQPFLVHVGAPEYRNCSWEFPNEVDVDFEIEIVAVERRTHKQTIQAWERVVTQRRQDVERRDRER